MSTSEGELGAARLADLSGSEPGSASRAIVEKPAVVATARAVAASTGAAYLVNPTESMTV